MRTHKWSNVRQPDAASRELLARLWAAGAGPADLAAPLTIDLDSTIVAVHGRAKQGAAFGYTKEPVGKSLRVGREVVEVAAVSGRSTCRRFRGLKGRLGGALRPGYPVTGAAR